MNFGTPAVSSAISGAFRGIGIGLRNASPTIMVVGGIGCMVASTVLAVNESEGGKKIIDEWSDHMEKADIMIAALSDPDDKEHQPTEDFNIPTIKQAKIKEHIDTAQKLAKNYAPAIFCGLAGIGLILGGHGIQIRRIGALGAALEAVSSQFSDYRENVKSSLGEDADKAFVAGGTVGDVQLEDAEGKKSTVKNAIVANPQRTALSFLFDETNPNWSKDAQANRFYIEQIQAWAQNMADYSGQISLAEVYKRMDFSFDDGVNGRNDEIKKVAYAIGWKRGDIVDFGLSELFIKMSEDGTVKYEPSMWITPNCCRSMFDGRLLHVLNKRIEGEKQAA